MSASTGASGRADTARIAAEVRCWLEDVVVGLGLCPFAAAPLEEDRVRIFVSTATSPQDLAADLVSELTRLDCEPAQTLETTLLVHPGVLQDFDDYNAFLDVADRILEHCGLVGTLQIASFHPRYRFAGAATDDVANATNRAPHPLLHLLREASVTRAIETHPDPRGIPARNRERLRELGSAEVTRRLAGRPKMGRLPSQKGSVS